MDISSLCIVIVAVASVLTIPIQMVRHLRADLDEKLKYGQNKFEKIVEQLEKCSDNMAAANANYAALNAKLDMLLSERGK